MKAARIGVVVAVLMLGLVPAVSADDGRFRDPRDSAGPQDVRALIHSHSASDPSRITHTIVTHGRWRTKRMACPEGKKCRAGYQIYITNDGDKDYERVIHVYRIDGRLRASMQTYHADPDCGTVQDPVCDDRGRSLGRIRVRRPDLRSVKVSFDVDKLSKRSIPSYGWRIFAAYRRSEPCPRDSYYDQMAMEYTCVDYAPEGNVYWRHRLD